MRWAAIATLVLAACGGGSPAPAVAPKQAAVESSKAEKDAKGLLEEIYETIGHGDTDGLMTLLAEPLVVYGPRKADALGTRSDALVALKALIDPKAKKKPSVRSGGIALVASPGGHSAWAIDVLDVPGGPFAVMGVLTNADDIWLVNAAAVAQTPSMKSLRGELKKDAVVPPGMTGIAKVDPNAKAAVDRFTRGLAEQQLWGDDLIAGEGAVVVGPSFGDVTRGKDIKKLWKKRGKANVRETAAGDTTAATTADGQLAWVTAPVVRFADDDDPLPLRVFAVFAKTGADWKMIALQESIAVDEPGVGVPFKKVIAPVVKQPDVPPPPPKVDEAQKPKKKKKKKKKPPPVTVTDDN